MIEKLVDRYMIVFGNDKDFTQPELRTTVWQDTICLAIYVQHRGNDLLLFNSPFLEPSLAELFLQRQLEYCLGDQSDMELRSRAG